ncbi:hypothetical protein [Shinella zoogloeoides]|uniref:hypothetical protein n=1 Tax=Shinella zoogloeoides TaxID=352475 RepID=UPI00299EA034|nr:hypothetical protein [Shinella zoogloeoides]WPE19848.1 hypothetical protein ShzoTeo12_10240 [Shinella zoogloeoides]
MQVTDKMLKALRRELKTFKPDDQLRRALTAALSEQQAVEMKARPLEWTTEQKSGFTIHVGRGLGLKYEACIKAYSPGWVVTLGQSDVIFDVAEADEENAKAAAQADYEQRIRSALVDVPAVEPDQRLYDGTKPMADGGDTPMTAAEEVLAWLLVEKIGVPDDVSYSPDQAQEIIVRQFSSPPLSREGKDSAEVERIITDLRHAASGLADRLQQTHAIDNAIAFLAALAATRSGSATIQKGCAE